MSFRQGARQFFERRGATPALPYDAEVEYLESTGTQWIDTGILCVDGQMTSARFRFTQPNSTEYLFGVSLARTAFYHIGHYFNPGYGGEAFSLASYSAHLVAEADSSWHEAVLDSTSGNRHVVFDDAVTPDTSTYTSPGSLSLVLFARRTNSATVSNYAHAQVSSCSIRDTSTGELIQDLVPVRKDGVGYMYDRVSGQLFGNAGTGAFVIGPDKS